MHRLALLSLVLVGCTDLELATTSSEVIGGSVTPAGKYPGIGALMYDFGGGRAEAGCTGSLIAPDVVLTAAHCIDPRLIGPAKPSFTLALDTRIGAEVITSRETIMHEQFRIDAEIGEGLGEFFDIGLVLLERPITEIAPVPMPRPQDGDALTPGLAMEIAGYGITDAAGNTGVLFDAETQLISLNPTELQVGMGSPQPQNCNGDSGGPGFASIGGKRRVIGIVSRSFSGFECNRGGVDTRVDAYLTWIHGKLPPGTEVPCDSGLADPCPVGPDPDGDDSGCCSSGSRGLPGTSALGFVVALALVRRRRQ
jgi:uncharacterized protein (TIGR03382 family)